MIDEIDKTYQQIENKILNHEIYQNVKDYSKAKEKIKTLEKEFNISTLMNVIDTKNMNKNIFRSWRTTKKCRY